MDSLSRFDHRQGYRCRLDLLHQDQECNQDLNLDRILLKGLNLLHFLPHHRHLLHRHLLRRRSLLRRFLHHPSLSLNQSQNYPHHRLLRFPHLIRFHYPLHPLCREYLQQASKVHSRYLRECLYISSISYSFCLLCLFYLSCLFYFLFYHQNLPLHHRRLLYHLFLSYFSFYLF